MDQGSQKEKIVHLQNEFNTIDTTKRGHLTADELKGYFATKPRKPSNIILNKLYSSLPNGELTQQRFVTFMLGFNIEMENLAVAKFEIEKNLSKYVDASPGGGVNEIKNSFLKFNVLAKNKASETSGVKNFFNLSLGCNKEKQNEKAAKINELLGRDCSDIFFLLKFKVSSKAEQITTLMGEMLNNLKALVGEMAPDLSEFIQSVNVECKNDGDFVYLIIELNELFFQDIAQFINELTAMLNPQAKIVLQLMIESAFLNNLLKESSQQQIEDLKVKFGLQVDNQSLSKVKQIFTNMIANEEIKIHSKKQKMSMLLMTLLNQIQFQANFSQSQQVIQEAGLTQGLEQMKGRLGILKEMQITQNAQGFAPGFNNFLGMLKENQMGQGQISLNVKNCFVMAAFNLKIEGLFDLI